VSPLEFILSCVVIFAVIFVLVVWLLGPFALAFILVYEYTHSGVASAIVAVFVEIVAILAGLVFIDVIS
jgi:hypothetical protein